jgi:hypothetical protein
MTGRVESVRDQARRLARQISVALPDARATFCNTFMQQFPVQLPRVPANVPINFIARRACPNTRKMSQFVPNK